MAGVNRRSTFAFGLVTASLLALPRSAATETYGPDGGKQLVSGVRQVNLGKRDTMILRFHLANGR